MIEKRKITENEIEILNAYFFRLVGDISIEQKSIILDKLEVVALNRGEILFKQGDESDMIYTLLTGKLEVIVEGPNNTTETVGYVHKSETVGEMGLITGDNRSATIVASRNSMLAKMSTDDFLSMCLENPQYAINVSKIVVKRLKDSIGHSKRDIYHSTLAIFTDAENEHMVKTAHSFSQLLKTAEDTKFIDLELLRNVSGLELNETLSSNGLAVLDSCLNNLEITHKRLLFNLVGMPSFLIEILMNYVELCVVFEAREDQVPSKETNRFYQLSQGLADKLHLVICHSPETVIPSQTAKYLEQRKVEHHSHIKIDDSADLERIHRLVDGKSNALVLGGGGAKGLAHLGVVTELAKADIPIDYVAGTSMGGIIAFLYGKFQNSEEMIRCSREIFEGNPTSISDMSLPPKRSIYKGKKIDQHIRRHCADIDIEDLWLPFFCISSNISSPSMKIHEKGSTATAVRASLSVPGLFPPILIDEEVHVDGGIFNNIPVDIMLTKNVGNIIAVRVDKEEKNDVKLNEIPGLLNTFVKSAVANSDSKAESLESFVDLYFEPQVSKFGLLGWKYHDKIMSMGAKHAIEKLQNTENLERYKYDRISKRYVHLKNEILKIFDNEWDPKLTYHNRIHTLDVLETLKRSFDVYSVPPLERELLKIAALGHDVGFLETYHGHEAAGAEIVRGLMKDSYDEEEIKTVESLILSTDISVKPKNLFEKLISDADLDYLGRDDFSFIGEKLFTEWVNFGFVENDVAKFDEKQIAFLEKFEFQTEWAKLNRGPKMKIRLKELHLKYQ